MSLNLARRRSFLPQQIPSIFTAKAIMSILPLALPALPASTDPLPPPTLLMDMTSVTKLYKAGNAGGAFGYTFAIQPTDDCYMVTNDIVFTELINIAFMTLNPSAYIDTFSTERIYKLCSTTFPIGQFRADPTTLIVVKPTGSQMPLVLLQPNISIVCPGGNCILQYEEFGIVDGKSNNFFLASPASSFPGVLSGSTFVDNLKIEGVTMFGGPPDPVAPLSEPFFMRIPGRNVLIKDCSLFDVQDSISGFRFMYAPEFDIFSPGLHQSITIEGCTFENNSVDGGIIVADGEADIPNPEDEAGRLIRTFVVSECRFTNNTFVPTGTNKVAMIDLGLVDEKRPYEWLYAEILNNCFFNNEGGGKDLIEASPGNSIVKGNSPFNQTLCLLDLVSAEQACAEAALFDDKQVSTYGPVSGNFSDELFYYEAGCGLEETFNPYAGRWLRYVGQGREITVDVCSGDNSETNRIQVFESCDGVDKTKCYQAGGCAATLAGTSGVEYYILLTSGDQDDSKQYEMTLSCRHRNCAKHSDCCAGTFCRRIDANALTGKCRGCRLANMPCTSNKECCSGKCSKKNFVCKSG